jgi:hypothetical protein
LYAVQGLASLDRAGGATSLIADAFGLLFRGTNECLVYEAKYQTVSKVIRRMFDAAAQIINEGAMLC